ncbi:EAL domain-containing protein [Gallaecimonas mangrovi]|uniref:EAL domain-containing protein n=1 Tax=Gallaecimonas mangrovi TaxID=2291597 RepID=UPI000E203820|nr:EAL domain-containing protein [Gallaecimonas mangrovi]
MLNRLLFLNDELQTPATPLWQMSVLRIITLSGLLLVLGVAAHSSVTAWRLGQYYVFYIVIVFYAVLLLATFLASRRYQVGRILLTGSVVAAGLVMQLFISNFALAKLGAIFLYSLPILVLLLWGPKATFVAMALNLLPFGYLLYDKPLPNWFGINLTLPDTPIYLQSLLFIFFNLCLPLGLMRMLKALKWHNSQQKHLNKQLNFSMLLYRDLFDNDAHPALIITSKNKVMRQNKALRHWLKDHKMSAQALAAALDIPVEDCTNAPRMVTPKSGKSRMLQLTKTQMAHNHYQLLLIDDITEASQLKLQLADERIINRRLRWHDLATGMLNDSGVEHWLSRKSTAGVALMQFCNGPGIRLRYGKDVKDLLLAKIASRVKALLPRGSIAGRIGRNTLIFCHPALDAQAMYGFMQAIEVQLGPQLALDDGRSFGMERHWQIGSHPGLLPLGHHLSTLAAHLSTQRLVPEQVTMLDASALKRFDSHHQLIEDLRQALTSEGQLYLDYQPQCDTQGNIVAAEALLRWNHPAQGNISPAVFIPVAEQSGNINRLTRWVVGQACSQLKAWAEQGIKLRISVNLSVLDLTDEGFSHWLISYCQQQQITPGSLELEITETALADPQQTSQSLKTLADAGFPLAIDDFGTGHSSLTRLTSLDADIIKIDRDFLKTVPGQPRSERMLKAIIDLCRATGAEPLVEGVETQQQLDWLLEQGCRFFQGFYLYKPMPPLTLAQILKAPSPA